MIYLIIKYDFDNLENIVAKAEISTIIGYTNTKEEAEKYIEEAEKINKEFSYTYTSWDDNSTYPKYKIQEVQNIEIVNVDMKKKGKNNYGL